MEAYGKNQKNGIIYSQNRKIRSRTTSDLDGLPQSEASIYPQLTTSQLRSEGSSDLEIDNSRSVSNTIISTTLWSHANDYTQKLGLGTTDDASKGHV